MVVQAVLATRTNNVPQEQSRLVFQALCLIAMSGPAKMEARPAVMTALEERNVASIDKEIARLKVRLAELEKLRTDMTKAANDKLQQAQTTAATEREQLILSEVLQRSSISRRPRSLCSPG